MARVPPGPPVGPQHVPGDPVQPWPRVLTRRVVTVSGRERPDPHLAEQVIGCLMSRPAREEPVNGDLVTPDDLDEGVGTAPRGALDQRAVRLHVTPPVLPLIRYCGKPARAFG